MIRFIAIDFDGTLYDDEKKVSEENIQAVLQARQRGIRVVPCSGRYEECMLYGVRALQLDQENEYYMCSNGVAIHRGGSHEVVYEALFPKKIIPWLIEYARNHSDQVNMQLYANNHHYVERYAESSAKYDKEAADPAVIVDRLEEIIPERIEKVAYTFSGTKEQMLAFQDEMAPLLPEGIVLFHVADYLLEFVDQNAGKWKAVHHLANSLGIPDDEILCIGDSENDYEMICRAGFGAVPANADALLKEKADYISPKTNNHSAVADIIRHYISTI